MAIQESGDIKISHIKCCIIVDDRLRMPKEFSEVCDHCRQPHDNALVFPCQFNNKNIVNLKKQRQHNIVKDSRETVAVGNFFQLIMVDGVTDSQLDREISPVKMHTLNSGISIVAFHIQMSTYT